MAFRATASRLFLILVFGGTGCCNQAEFAERDGAAQSPASWEVTSSDDAGYVPLVVLPDVSNEQFHLAHPEIPTFDHMEAIFMAVRDAHALCPEFPLWYARQSAGESPDRELLDGWGRKFEASCDWNGPVLRSSGADGVFSTQDDITFTYKWMMRPRY